MFMYFPEFDGNNKTAELFYGNVEEISIKNVYVEIF
jgi:hypothetical protein